MYKSKRSQATNFTKEVKLQMLERDNHSCIFCKTTFNLTPAHYISRSKGGLGILENGACVCVECHQFLDHSSDREQMLLQFKMYLQKYHQDFPDIDRVFSK